MTEEEKLRTGLIARQKKLQQVESIVKELRECWLGHIKCDWCPCEEPTEVERASAQKWFELLEMLWVLFGVEWESGWYASDEILKAHLEMLKRKLNAKEPKDA